MADREWWLTACFDWPRDKWLGYVSGYRRAADVLFSHVESTGRDQDTLIYPYLMCWRHYSEIQLKTLITLFQRALRKEEQIKRSHKIDLLWKELRHLFFESQLVDNDDAMAAVDRVLRQLNELDPSSEHFRYPITAKGADTLPGLSRLHFRGFHEAMEAAANYLDACDTMIRVHMDTQREIAEAFMPHDLDGFTG